MNTLWSKVIPSRKGLDTKRIRVSAIEGEKYYLRGGLNGSE